MKPLLPRDVVGATRIGTEQLPEPADRVEVREALDALLGSLRTLERELALLRDRIEGIEALLEMLEARLLDVKSVERRLLATIAGLRTVLLPGPDTDNLVRWLEWSGKGSASRRNLVLAAAPIILGNILRDELFARTETVVLTSATLATRGSFDFLRARLGIDQMSLEATDSPPRVTQAVVPSPFDFETQSLLLVPTDLPDMNAQGDAFQQALIGRSVPSPRAWRRLDARGRCSFRVRTIGHGSSLASSRPGMGFCSAPHRSGRVSMFRDIHCGGW